jgi:hypothetical protein
LLDSLFLRNTIAGIWVGFLAVVSLSESRVLIASPYLLMGTFNLLPDRQFGRPQFIQNHQISPIFLFDLL